MANRRDILLLLFLGVLACALCYVLWNHAVQCLGPVETNLYLYLNPVTTVIAAAVILGERITRECLLGTALIFGGLILSEVKIGSRAREKKGELEEA